MLLGVLSRVGAEVDHEVFDRRNAMARRKRTLTEAIMKNRQSEGRGRGDGATYKPWIYVHDVPSTGRSSRIFNGERIMHTLSDWETTAVRQFQWDPDVLDIKEQYPLPLEVTQRIAREMKVRHPCDSKSRVDIPITTDLVITRRIKNAAVLLARSIKEKAAVEYHASLTRPQLVRVGRTIQKLEIERRYWEEINVSWMLLTEVHLSKSIKSNLEFIQPVKPDPKRPRGYWKRARQAVLEALATGGSASIEEIAIRLAGEGILQRPDVTTCMRLLCKERRIGFDMNSQFRLSMKASDFTIYTGMVTT
jgi:TnsA endonuclease N terminal